MLKYRILSYDRPSIIFTAFPEPELVRPFSGEVHSQSGSPRSNDQGKYYQTDLHASPYCYDPCIRNGKKAPQLVHLRIIARDLSDDKAVQNAAAAYDEQRDHSAFLHL